jgi:hypothetical protein
MDYEWTSKPPELWYGPGIVRACTQVRAWTCLLARALPLIKGSILLKILRQYLSDFWWRFAISTCDFWWRFKSFFFSMFFSRMGAAEIPSTMSCFCDKQKCPKENQHFNRLEFPKCLCVWVLWTSNAVIRCGELRNQYSLAWKYRMWSKQNCSATNSLGVTRENGVPTTNVTHWTTCSGKVSSVYK